MDFYGLQGLVVVEMWPIEALKRSFFCRKRIHFFGGLVD